MANKKQSKLGFDPLAWMGEDDDNTTSHKETDMANTNTNTSQTNAAHPLGLNVPALEQSFRLLAPTIDSVVADFYAELFRSHPAVKPMFANTDTKKQQQKLVGALKLVMNNINNVDALAKALTTLGAKHQGYGARPEHYGAVAEVLLKVMKQHAGRAWTKEVESAWAHALEVIANVMLGAYSEAEGNEMAANYTTMSGMDEEQQFELVRMRSAVNGAMTAIMMIDRDLVITYANKSTVDLLSKHEPTLRTLYPGFAVSKLVGTCIDIFHKNPAHQRQLLSNPANLPYSTDIQVGPLVFRINVSACVDEQGEYIGNTLEWSDVTELRTKEKEVARLMSAINGAQTNLMLCDENLNITYANPAVVQMLARRQNVLRSVWPSLDAHNLIGQNIDQFHKNPAHQRALLSDASRLPAKAEIKVGDLEFEVNATMIKGPRGEYMGNMVEWKDITEQKDAERQIQNLIDSAAMGLLDSRIDASAYRGFMHTLAEGINSLMAAVVSPIRDTKRVMGALAQGDLTQNIDAKYHGEFAELAESVNSSIDNLYRMVNEIREACASISSAAGEIAQGNTDLSQRTEEQASSLEETASSMEEMTGTVKQNADNARQANQLASAAREQAERGGEVVEKAVTAMGEINSSSKKIADIISVIDEIAFQTNLLALNAAVEAARAGEQGRGFAVVAGEVRNLAQRSAGAAKEIKSLIKDSVEKVGEGSKLVDESGATLDEIVNAVKKVSDIIAEIAAAGQEQSAGIEQVNKAVMQMDEMTQQNAALVEEAASASESMEEQARSLLDLISYFNVGEEETVAPVKKPAMQQRPAPQAHRERPLTSARTRVAKRPAAQQDDDGEWNEF